MQRDKAALKYLGRTQLERAFELASRHVDKVFVSVRADQISDPTRAPRPMIVDLGEGEARLSAFAPRSLLTLRLRGLCWPAIFHFFRMLRLKDSCAGAIQTA